MLVFTFEMVDDVFTIEPLIFASIIFFATACDTLTMPLQLTFIVLETKNYISF